MIRPGTVVSNQSGDLGVVVPVPDFMRQAAGVGDVFVVWYQYTANCIVSEAGLNVLGSVDAENEL